MANKKNDKRTVMMEESMKNYEAGRETGVGIQLDDHRRTTLLYAGRHETTDLEGRYMDDDCARTDTVKLQEDDMVMYSRKHAWIV